jgi:23S rRNA (adenine2030-N6)-methyltransferase
LVSGTVLSYRHGFHAGNFADVVKHVVLIELLQALARKPAPCFVLDTHAGAGCYDLAAPAATRREHEQGIARLWRPDGACPAAVGRYLELVRAANAPDAAQPRRYPGSPWIERASLRAHDRLVCCELHPADYAALREVLGGDPRVELRHADGYAALAALLPPRERRGLVLVDPAYERRDELDRLLAGLESGLERFAHGLFVLWYPIARTVAAARLHAAVAAGGARKVLRVELCVRPDDHPLGLNGSGLLIVNPPHRSADALSEDLRWLHPRLAPEGGGRVRVDWLVPE